jgi:hypothetical protein
MSQREFGGELLNQYCQVVLRFLIGELHLHIEGIILTLLNVMHSNRWSILTIHSYIP